MRVPALCLATLAVLLVGSFGIGGAAAKAVPTCKVGQKSTKAHPCVKRKPKPKPKPKTVPKVLTTPASDTPTTSSPPATSPGGNDGQSVDGCGPGETIPQGGDGDDDDTNAGADDGDGDGCI